MSLQSECTDQIAEMLKARGETVAVAESTTGGLISARLLAVPGASAYYERALSLPLFPHMADEDVDCVVAELQVALGI